MRFGRRLHEHRIAEWAPYYVDYYRLKRLIKSAVQDAPAIEQQARVDLSTCITAIDEEISGIQLFYNSGLERLQHRYEIVIGQGGVTDINQFRPEHVPIPQDSFSDLAEHLRYRQSLQKFRWYGKVNSDGLKCISRKLERFHFASDSTPAFKDHEFHAQIYTMREIERVDKLINALHQLEASTGDFLVPNRILARLFVPVDTKTIHKTLQDDDSDALHLALGANRTSQPLLRFLLHEGALRRSRNCVRMVARHLRTNLQDDAFGTHRNILHSLVISASNRDLLGREAYRRGYHKALLASTDQEHLDYASALRLVFEVMTEDQRAALQQKDYRGRTALHDAAELGSKELCELMLLYIKEWGTDGEHEASSAVLLPDDDGNSPLLLSVSGSRTEATRTLLQHVNPDESIGDKLAALLHTALLNNCTKIVNALLTTRLVNVNFVGANGETALYIAARARDSDLIETLAAHGVDINSIGSSYGWTPLIVACVFDRIAAAETLLKLGADENRTDYFGWTALDHVAYRGYWKISHLLQRRNATSLLRIPKAPLPATNAMSPCHPSVTRIFVNVGPLNTRKAHAEVDLTPHLSKFPTNVYPEVGFSIICCGIGTVGSEGTIELPMLDDTTNYPFLFETTDACNAKLVFKLMSRTSSSGSLVHVGAAVALLQELGDVLGPGRESLFRDHTLPIIGCTDFEYLGSITVNFLLVKPFPDPRSSPGVDIDGGIWNANGTTKLIGHRGLGMNSPAFKRLQIGENTIQSFKATIDLGVSYVECDVQLTRDHVPVIYHDFLMSESGADIAPHNLSFDQFMCISAMQRPAGKVTQNEGPGSENKGFAVHFYQSPKQFRQRSYSFGNLDDCRTQDLLGRIQHTHEYKVKGFKGNVRGAHIHDSFATLEQLLRDLPEDVALDIELKYPMLWEAEDWKMDLYGVELNLYTDTTLEKIYQHGRKRPILFTSFSPELCILASHKQNTYPVMFLNESNLFPTGDVRASNLQEAIHFARHWGLPGIVMSSEPFIASPGLIRFVKDAGLVCTSFGLPNNDPDNAKIQVAAGLDAIIVDSVALINHSFKEQLKNASVPVDGGVQDSSSAN